MSVSVDLNNTERVMYQGNNHVKCIYGPNNTLLWSEEEYFTVETLVGGNSIVGLLKNQGSSSELITLYYWINTYPNAARDNYTGTITSSRSGNVYISGLNAGDKVRFYRAEQTSWRYADSDYVRFVINSCNLYGNIASLFGFVSTPPSYACFNMFNGCGIVDASGLIIPWNTLSENCFLQTFLNCTTLTGQPALTSQNLAQFCYRAMFRGCHALTDVAPIYTKNINVQWPFYCMYQLCNGFTSVTIPEFQGYYQRCLGGMFWGCPNLTSAEVKVPSGLSLPNSPFTQMFVNCSSLNSVKCNADTFVSTPFTNTNWLSGVASTGTFTKKAGTNWASGASGIPTGWTVVEE